MTSASYTLPDNRDHKALILPILITGLLSLIPWPEIIYQSFHAVLWDREIYIQKIMSGDTLFSYFTYDSLISYFTYEYSWEFLINLFQENRLPFDYDVFFQIISSLFIITSSLILYRKGGYISILLMANPLVFDLAYSQLRSALAISLLNILYLTRPKSNLISLAVCLLATSIHTAMAIFLAIYFLCVATSERGGWLSRFSVEMRLVTIVGAGLAFGLLIGPLREVALTLLNDRRAEYGDLASSPLYLSFWIMLFGLFLLNYREFIQTLEGRFSLFVLALVAVNIFTSAHSIRFLALAYPYIMATILIARPAIRSFSLAVFSVYLFAQWYFYLSGLGG